MKAIAATGVSLADRGTFHLSRLLYVQHTASADGTLLSDAPITVDGEDVPASQDPAGEGGQNGSSTKPVAPGGAGSKGGAPSAKTGDGLAALGIAGVAVGAVGAAFAAYSARRARLKQGD